MSADRAYSRVWSHLRIGWRGYFTLRPRCPPFGSSTVRLASTCSMRPRLRLRGEALHKSRAANQYGLEAIVVGGMRGKMKRKG
jgi:hypothetical protein